MPNFNDMHPELEPGEEFVINIRIPYPGDPCATSIAEALRNAGDPSLLRMGGVAFTYNGLRIPAYVPIFRILKQ